MTISITITFDAADLIALITQLSTTPAPSVPSVSSVPPVAPIPPRPTGRPPKRTTANGHPTPNPVSSVPSSADPVEASTEPTPPPADPVEASGHHRNTQPRSPLPFETFDALVRREVKRLSIDGRIPGHRLWESERDQRLPTLTAVIQRYNVTNLIDFADLMGMEPPLRALPFGGALTNAPTPSGS